MLEKPCNEGRDMQRETRWRRKTMRKPVTQGMKQRNNDQATCMDARACIGSDQMRKTTSETKKQLQIRMQLT